MTKLLIWYSKIDKSDAWKKHLVRPAVVVSIFHPSVYKSDCRKKTLFVFYKWSLQKNKLWNDYLPISIDQLYNWAIFTNLVYGIYEINKTKQLLYNRMFNSLWPSDSIWWHDLGEHGSGNGLLPGGTKPLPEPMFTFHWWSYVTFTFQWFHMKCS